MNIIEIWSPKYSTNSVLVSKFKVKEGLNYIKFTKAKHLSEGYYVIDGQEIKTYPLQKNGAGLVYVVPFKSFKHTVEE